MDPKMRGQLPAQQGGPVAPGQPGQQLNPAPQRRYDGQDSILYDPSVQGHYGICHKVNTHSSCVRTHCEERILTLELRLLSLDKHPILTSLRANGPMYVEYSLNYRKYR